MRPSFTSRALGWFGSLMRACVRMWPDSRPPGHMEGEVSFDLGLPGVGILDLLAFSQGLCYGHECGESG